MIDFPKFNGIGYWFDHPIYIKSIDNHSTKKEFAVYKVRGWSENGELICSCASKVLMSNNIIAPVDFFMEDTLSDEKEFNFMFSKFIENM